MTIEVDRDAQAEAIVAALTAALVAELGPGYRAFDYDELFRIDAAKRPTEYVVIDLSRRYVPGQMASGEAAAVGGRLGTRYVAATMSNARQLQRVVTATVEDKVLGTPESPVGPFAFETEEPIVPDEGGYSGRDDWTF